MGGSIYLKLIIISISDKGETWDSFRITDSLDAMESSMVLYMNQFLD
jgi:hypothetical protein